MSSLGVPAVASFKKHFMKKKKSYGNTSSLLPFGGPVVGVGTFSRLLVAPSIGPEKNVAMSPSSTTVHEGQHDISRVTVSWLIRTGGNPPPHKYRLHNLHIFASYCPPRAINFKEGDMGTFFYRT